jgi:hypothetical protein
MHALSKTLFFTTGTVGLLILVFLWSALKYGLFKLNHLIEAVLSFKFAGFYITEFLLLSGDLDPGLKIHTIKIVVTAGVGIGSIFLIILSYLPRLSWQLKSLSCAVSILLFSILTLFWLTLFSGHEIILHREKNAIFGFTVVTYLIGVFSLWYAMKKKPQKTLKKSSMEPVSRPTAIRSVGEKIAESVVEKEDASSDISSTKEDESKEVTKKEEVNLPETSNEVDSTAEGDTDGNTPESLDEESGGSEEEIASQSNQTDEQSESDLSIIEEEQAQPPHVDEDAVPPPDASEESEKVDDLEKIPELTEKNPA